MDIKEKRRLRLQEWFADKTLPIKDKSYISQIVTGKSGLGEKGAARLEHEYNMPSGYLVAPHTDAIPDYRNQRDKHSACIKYPVLTSEQARNWPIGHDHASINENDWLEAGVEIFGDAFWLKIEGESMAATTGISISEGTYVLFDTGRKAINGSLVLTELNQVNAITFKKLVIDGGQKYLKALNPLWPSIIPLSEDCRIIGIGVEAKIKLV